MFRIRMQISCYERRGGDFNTPCVLNYVRIYYTKCEISERALIGDFCRDTAMIYDLSPFN